MALSVAVCKSNIAGNPMPTGLHLNEQLMEMK